MGLKLNSSKAKDFIAVIGGTRYPIKKGILVSGGQQSVFWTRGIPIFREGEFLNTRHSNPLSHTSVMNEIRGTSEHTYFSVNFWRDNYSGCIDQAAAFSSADGSISNYTLIQKSGGSCSVSGDSLIMTSRIILFIPINSIASTKKTLKVEFGSGTSGEFLGGIGTTSMGDGQYNHYVGTYFYPGSGNSGTVVGSGSTYEYELASNAMSSAKWLMIYCMSGTLYIDDIAFID